MLRTQHWCAVQSLGGTGPNGCDKIPVQSSYSSDSHLNKVVHHPIPLILGLYCNFSLKVCCHFAHFYRTVVSVSLCLRRSSTGRWARNRVRFFWSEWSASAEELLFSEWATAVQPQALPPGTHGGYGWTTTSKGVLDTRRGNPNNILKRLGREIVYYW